jgi:heptosyltransferase II
MIKNAFWILIAFMLSPFFYIKISHNRLIKNGRLKILLIYTGKIGDLVCTTPIFREIKKNLPDSFLTIAIREQSYGVVQNNPHVDKFIFFNAQKYQGFSGEIKLIKDLVKEKFTHSINLSPRAFNTIIPFFAGIPERTTSTSKFTGRVAAIFSIFSNHRLEYKQHTSKLRHNLEILKFLGINNFSEKKEVFITDEENKRAIKFLSENNLQEGDLLIGITASAGNKLKEWESDKFIQLTDKLIDELGARIVFIGAPNDKVILENIVNDMKNKATVAIDFKLNELAALFKKIKLFISVDTGPLYIAHAVGTLVVDITGPCDIEEQPPRDGNAKLVYRKTECWPCSFVIPPARHCRRKHLRCIKDVSVGDVFDAAVELMRENHIL